MATVTEREWIIKRENETWREYTDRQVAELDSLMEEEDVIHFPVADGRAFYVVKRISPPELEWVPFLDNYRIPEAHERGLDAVDIRAQLQAQKRLAELFSTR